MARTASKMVSLGTKAPSFELPDVVSGKSIAFEDLKSEVATVVMFICNHCPFVKHVQDGIVSLAKDYQSQGVAFVAISSNDVENYPEDSPELMSELASKYHYSFPYLYDETQAVAKAFGATCTPDFFVYNKDLELVYRGQMDDSRPDNGVPVSGKDLRAALDAILAGKAVDPKQQPSMGCNIKWRE